MTTSDGAFLSIHKSLCFSLSLSRGVACKRAVDEMFGAGSPTVSDSGSDAVKEETESKKRKHRSSSSSKKKKNRSKNKQTKRSASDDDDNDEEDDDKVWTWRPFFLSVFGSVCAYVGLWKVEIKVFVY